MTDDQNLPEIDPIQDCTESLLYGDPETVAQKLRAAIHHEAAKLNAHQSRAGVINRELNASMAVAKQYSEDPPPQ